MVTPRLPSRSSQVRSSGEVLSDAGNTRPLEPTKVGWPRLSLQARNAAGGNASIAARNSGSHVAVAAEEQRQRLRCG